MFEIRSFWKRKPSIDVHMINRRKRKSLSLLQSKPDERKPSTRQIPPPRSTVVHKQHRYRQIGCSLSGLMSTQDLEIIRGKIYLKINILTNTTKETLFDKVHDIPLSWHHSQQTLGWMVRYGYCYFLHSLPDGQHNFYTTHTHRRTLLTTINKVMYHNL